MAINMGDVITDGDAIYGDGITIASRLESLAEPGGVNVSRAVRDQVRDQLAITFKNLGEPYRDDNENGAYDLGEYFLDYNRNGLRDPPDGTFHGLKCSIIPPATRQTCTTDTLAIGVEALIVMSTGGANITLVPNSATLSFSVGATAPVTFNVQDLNGNTLPAGTAVSVLASSGVGTITGGTFTVPCSTSIGGQNYTAILAAATVAGSGNISITVIAPSGVTTVLNVPTTIM